jgi:hypothetical protein
VPQYQPICTICNRLRKVPTLACDAFPDGVPVRIAQGISLHLAPVKGDSGLTFELDEDRREVAEAKVAADLLPASILRRKE